MVKMSWKIYGDDGHRQRLSFGESWRWNFSKDKDVRRITVLCEDVTGTNNYVIVEITRNTAEECIDELNGQLSDGIFENIRYGKVVLIRED